MSKVIFRSVDVYDVKIKMEDDLTWKEQADVFFDFLSAQGFVLSEKDLAEHYLVMADGMGNLRANND